MSQTLSQPAAPSAVSRRTAQFGVALIAAILVACFTILIVARAEARPATEQAAPVVVR